MIYVICATIFFPLTVYRIPTIHTSYIEIESISGMRLEYNIKIIGYSCFHY